MMKDSPITVYGKFELLSFVILKIPYNRTTIPAIPKIVPNNLLFFIFEEVF